MATCSGNAAGSDVKECAVVLILLYIPNKMMVIQPSCMYNIILNAYKKPTTLNYNCFRLNS